MKIQTDEYERKLELNILDKNQQNTAVYDTHKLFVICLNTEI